ncbi:hypothetical protein B0I37DRAFT_443797 [Chaetomium sp. MPI-CAGE-AT-0009]|nr:hypothetical protein B0I37DRAFT_443797 [Chaetomium sp. MPI-CAGE-AT-0009]
MKLDSQTVARIIQRDADNDLDKQAEWIRVLIARLLELLNRDDAKNWERIYKIRDLTEEVQRLKRQLRDSLPIGDPDSPSEEAMSALEVAQDKIAEALRAKILLLEAELRGLGGALQRERSKNWDLEYQCQDLREEVWRLTMHLSHSVTISDWEEAPLVPKTARERALEERIRGLEKRVRELDDKVRNRDVKMGNTEGSGRARSKSM